MAPEQMCIKWPQIAVGRKLKGVFYSLEEKASAAASQMEHRAEVGMLSELRAAHMGRRAEEPWLLHKRRNDAAKQLLCLSASFDICLSAESLSPSMQ